MNASAQSDVGAMMATSLESRLPEEVMLLLKSELNGGREPDLFAQADIGKDGRFSEAWVVLIDRRLAVVNRHRQPAPMEVIPLDSQTELELVTGLGGSRFRIVRQGKLADELRFSCRQAKRFSELLHRSQARIKATEEPAQPPIGTQAVAPPIEKICPKCQRLIPDWADTCPRCLHQRRIFWRLLSFVRPYRRLWIPGLLVAVAGTLLQLVPPWLLKELINRVFTPAHPHYQPGLLWPIIGATAAVMLLRLLLGKWRLYCFAQLGEMVAHDLRHETFTHLQKLSLAYYAKKPTGNLISRITNDTDRLWDFIAFGIVDVGLSILTLAGISLVLFTQNWVLALLTLAPIPISMMLMWMHIKRMHRLLTRAWNKWSRMSSVLSDVIPGARVVKAFTQEQRESSRFRQRSKAVVEDVNKVHDEWTTFWPRLSFTLQCGTILIWAYASPRIINQEIDLGTFMLFLGYVGMFYGPVEHLGQLNRMFQRAVTSAHRVFEVLDTPPQIYTRSAAQHAPAIKGSITFENVSFSYDGIKRVLQDVSFRIEPGEVIGLAGPSGGGKTTMINLICRFYDPIEGRILIDGVDLRDYDVQELRRQIGVVLQEPYLFRGSVTQNIAYGHPDADMRRIIAAAKAANAHDFIVGFPDGYDTPVGERGQTVSGGERQRLSIARAILGDPRILIFDEATSSVDSKTEQRIQQAIDRLVRGRTTIAIAHRLSTLRRAHRLLILDKGKLVEQGTHDELIAKGGIYAGLHKTQAELHALFAV